MAKLRLLSYKGHHQCKQRFGCEKIAEIPIEVTFLKDQYEFQKGHNILTFAKGQTVLGHAKIVDREIYCIWAYSNRSEATIEMDKIYISLKWIKVHVKGYGIAYHCPGGLGV